MGKVLKAVAVIAIAVAVAYFAPQLLPSALSFLGTATAAAITTAVVSTAIAMAVTTGISLLAGKPSTSGATPSVFRQTVANSFIIYGKRRVGGLLIFFHPRGKDFRYFVIAVAGHRCKGVVRWWLGDEQVTVDGSGKVLTGKYAGNAWLWFTRGTEDQAAHPTFVAETDGKWTAAHRGRGTALIYAKFKMTDDVVQAGMPNITAEVEGKDDILDPRTGARGYTRNAALVFYDWLAMAREEGGFGAYDDEIDWDWVAAQAGVADELVDTPIGQERRYEFDSYIQTGAAPSEVRDTFVTCCAGSFTYSGGKMLMRPGYYVPPSATLQEADLAGPITVPALLAGDQMANEVTGTYIESDKYQPADVPTRAIDATDVRQASFDLPHITSIYRGQRLLEIFLRKAQAERRVTWPMNIMGIAISTLDTVQLGTARYGLSNYAFQVVNWGLNQDFSVGLQLEETGPDIFHFTPGMYLEPGEVGQLTPADPIDDRATRGAYQLIGSDNPYPVTTTSTTAKIAAFQGTLDTGRIVNFPAGEVTGLTEATDYIILYALSDVTQNLTGPEGETITAPDGQAITTTSFSGSYVARVAPALDELALPGWAVIRRVTTAAADGTYPTPQDPPPGDGGGGYGGGGGNTCPTEDAMFLTANSDRTGPGDEIPAGEVTTATWAWTQHETTGAWGAFRVVAVSKHWSKVCRAEADQLPQALAGIVVRALRASPLHRIGGAPWTRIEQIGRPDGEAIVVAITVEDAHTYVVGGVLSHNIKQNQQNQA